MVRHEAVRVQRAGTARHELSQQVHVRVVVGVVEETVAPIVSALDDVDTKVRDYQSRGAGHIVPTTRVACRLTQK